MKLPVDELLPDILATLERHASLVLQAAPGAGKTTRVPPALLDADWCRGRRVIMLEPRRLAARAAARYMAARLGEPVGETVGYRVRMEARAGPRTRLEVVTEGVFTRLIQADPALEDYAAVIFDEFHERSLQADLGLALCLETREALRPDLRLVLMSATLDGLPVAELLDAASVLESPGRQYPVTVHYRPPGRRERLERHVAGVLREVLAREAGSVLVFLPGVGEIRRVASLLEPDLPRDVRLAPLYGDLDSAEQDAAIAPAPAGSRKLVLATAIAETSLTIEGVRVVVDAGLARRPRFDPRGGMTRLVTERVSRAEAEQRAGRAGRLEPGVCYRLWSEGEPLAAQPLPEILSADLVPLALELAGWGAADPAGLRWLDPPPSGAFAQARELLQALGALDAAGRMTAHGRELLRLPVHPRLAHMLLEARKTGWGESACLLAALLSERDPLAGRGDADIRERLQLLRDDRRRGGALRAVARGLRRQLGMDGAGAVSAEHAGLLLALAYPDRIAQARGGRGRFRLANGRGAFLPEDDPLAGEPWLAVAELDGREREARIFLAAPLRREDLESRFAEGIRTRDEIRWDGRGVSARRLRQLGALVLDEAPLPRPEPAAVQNALLEGLRQAGLQSLGWTPAARQWQARVAFLRHELGEAWPDVSDAALLARLEDWLGPFLAGMTRLTQVQSVDLLTALNSLLDHGQQRALDALAPTHLQVPSGSRRALDYRGEVPVLAVRLQEMFGATDTPRVAGGRVPVLLQLLSPAQRPVQLTRDLAGFWRGAYHEVKKDLKGRYPRHHWPDDPFAAAPTARAKGGRRGRA